MKISGALQGEPAGFLKDFLDPPQATKRGRTVLGHYPIAVADSETSLTWTQVSVRQRRNELRKLALHRYRTSQDIGPAASWVMALCNLCVCMNRPATHSEVDDLAAAIGYRGKIHAILFEAIARDMRAAAKEWWTHKLLSPDEIGHLLEVTILEREEAKLRKIGSIEETASERSYRLNNDRRRKPKAPKAWEIAGIPRSTWYRLNSSQ